MSIPFSHQQAVRHTCTNPECGRAFDGSPSRLYCTAYCRRRTAQKREALRDQEVERGFAAQAPDARYLGTVNNATMEDLLARAAVTEVGKAWKLTGVIPSAKRANVGQCVLDQDWTTKEWLLSNTGGLLASFEGDSYRLVEGKVEFEAQTSMY